MKNLIKILSISLAIGLLGIEKAQDLQEIKTRKFYFSQEVIKDIATIRQEKVEFYYAKPKFNLKGKKVKIINGSDYREYVSMIESSKEVKALVKKIKSETTIKTAIKIYDLIKKKGIHYIYDPGTSSSTVQEGIKLKEERKKNGETDLEIIINNEYVKHPDQTLKDKGGDCEDLSILYSSLLIAKGFQAGLIVFQNHIMSIFKIDKKEIEKNDLKNYLKDNDGNFWIPVEVSSIEKKNFFEALQEGYNNFLHEFPCYRVVFNSYYVKK